MDYDISSDERVSTAIIRAVSAVSSRDMESLQPLDGVLDPTALDALFEPRPNGSPRTGGRLTFVYSDCRLTVDNGEHITVQPLATRDQTQE